MKTGCLKDFFCGKIGTKIQGLVKYIKNEDKKNIK